MSKCKTCGRSIKWVETLTGKPMPCDYPAKPYIAGIGTDIIVKETGEVISGAFVKIDNSSTVKPDGYGYMSHFATCPEADQFRRKKDKPEDEQMSLF